MADYQKESAIESFCDICLARAAIGLLGERWKGLVEALRNQRAEKSKALRFFEADEYATVPALDAFLDCDGNMAPQEGARISLKSSIQHTSRLKKAAISTSMGLFGLKKGMRERLELWRGK